MFRQKLKSKFLLFLLLLLFIFVYLLANIRLYFFDDEFFTLWVCQANWSNFLSALKATDAHPPLSYIFFKILFSIFGENIYAVQVLSLIFVVCGLFVYLYTFSKLFPIIKWLFTLVAIHPLLVLWAGAARYYPLLFFLFNLGIPFFIKIFNKDYRIKTLIFYVIISVLGIYTEFMYFLALLPQCLLILISIMYEKDKNRRLFYLFRFTLIVIIIAIAYLPWLPQTAILIFQNLQRFARPSAVLNFAYIIYGGFIGQSIMPYDFFVVIPAVITFGFLFISGIIKMVKDTKDNFFIWLGLSSGAIIFAIPIRLATVRHFLFMPGLLLIPVLYAIASNSSKWLRYLFITIVASIFIYADINIALKRDIHKGGMTDPIGEIIHTVVNLSCSAKDAKIILYSNVLNYYLKEKKELNSKLVYLDAEDPQIPAKLFSMFDKIRPHRLIYIWNYYGAQPDYARLDNLLQRFLDKEYIIISELKFNKDNRLKKISKLIDKYYMNPKGYRFLIQEYQLKENINKSQE